MINYQNPLQSNPNYRWEDAIVGESMTSGMVKISEADIVAFASLFDPLPIHIDKEAAESSVFGSLTASGAHINAIRQRLMYDFEYTGGVIALLGFKDVRYSAALKPGLDCHVEVSFISKRESKSNAKTGLLEMQVELYANDEMVLSMVEMVLMKRR